MQRSGTLKQIGDLAAEAVMEIEEIKVDASQIKTGQLGKGQRWIRHASVHVEWQSSVYDLTVSRTLNTGSSRRNAACIHAPVEEYFGGSVASRLAPRALYRNLVPVTACPGGVCVYVCTSVSFVSSECSCEVIRTEACIPARLSVRAICPRFLASFALVLSVSVPVRPSSCVSPILHRCAPPASHAPLRPS